MRFETFNADYVRRLTDGDTGAGEHFATYFGNLLFMKLRMRLRSAALIEDVRQETLTRVLVVLRQGAGVERPERFGAFVNGVCNNVVREFCRLDGREEAWDENVEEPSDPSVDLDAQLVNDELKREVERIFAALPEKDRRILQAIYLDEIDKADICRLFHVDAGYLRVLLYRAKIQFRKAYRGGPANGSPPVNPSKQ